MATPIHSKIINNAATETLKPIGVKRKGQSRIWIDDNGWWLIVIEFQPSSRARGTFLNVGINFQWYSNDHISFDIGHREASFVEYVSEDQFSAKAKELSEQAKEKVIEIRNQFTTPESAQEFILSALKAKNGSLWAEFHQGMICTINGDNKEALLHFKQLLNIQANAKYARELKDYTNIVVSKIQSGEDVFKMINETIELSRELKNLGPSESPITYTA